MKPISKRNFGSQSDRIRISFLDDSGTTVTGYILSQMGLKRFKVTPDGINIYIVELAQTVEEASSLTDYAATILCHPHGSSEPEHVREIWSKVLTTVEGNRYAWSRGTVTEEGTAQVDTNGAV